MGIPTGYDLKLTEIVRTLEKHYGRPDPVPDRDPLALILWENVAYLADDNRRASAFQALREKVGLRPEDLLKAPAELLRDIGRAGILPDLTVEKIKTIARIALADFKGDLNRVCELPFPEAKKALKKFPSIGDPGAEKILLFTKNHPVLALESNGLRVLMRLGFGGEKKNYAATYQSVREATAGEIVEDFDWLIRAHQLLRRHGQTLCKRSKPVCVKCPLAGECPSASF